MRRQIQHFSLLVVSTFTLVLCSTLVCLGGEDINAVDDKGNRQGYWKITGEMSAEEGFRDNQLVEEGNYENNKKTGVWKKYYPAGSLQYEITFQNNFPRGPYKIYYPDGKLEESGNWQGNKNVGTFKRYHTNGKPAQIFNFTTEGKRDGVQTYFYDNGNLQLTVEVSDGTVNGIYETYYPDGQLKSEKRVENGVVDESSVKTYEPSKNEYANAEMPELPEKVVSSQDKEKVSVEAFNRSGKNTLYNKRKQVTQIGEFKDGRLWNGKWHRYDLEGNLQKIEVYSEGKFVGYGRLEAANN
ncbi:MAG: toxin-antitoxin system YwqK family antitoxin [Cryomorphaceae bacterium]